MNTVDLSSMVKKMITGLTQADYNSLKEQSDILGEDRYHLHNCVKNDSGASSRLA